LKDGGTDGSRAHLIVFVATSRRGGGGVIPPRQSEMGLRDAPLWRPPRRADQEGTRRARTRPRSPLAVPTANFRRRVREVHHQGGDRWSPGATRTGFPWPPCCRPNAFVFLRVECNAVLRQGHREWPTAPRGEVTTRPPSADESARGRGTKAKNRRHARFPMAGHGTSQGAPILLVPGCCPNGCTMITVKREDVACDSCAARSTIGYFKGMAPNTISTCAAKWPRCQQGLAAPPSARLLRPESWAAGSRADVGTRWCRRLYVMAWIRESTRGVAKSAAGGGPPDGCGYRRPPVAGALPPLRNHRG